MMSLNYTLITDKNIDYKFTVIMNGDTVCDDDQMNAMVYKGNNTLQVFVRDKMCYCDLTAFDLNLVLTNPPLPFHLPGSILTLDEPAFYDLKDWVMQVLARYSANHPDGTKAINMNLLSYINDMREAYRKNDMRVLGHLLFNSDLDVQLTK
jgi:hypothetical protein